jgi:FADH2 O2-dependent halogenase
MSDHHSPVDFEVGIIGGGPAGSGLATYLAQAGVSCIVFEREKFPRPHVGESLVPAANRVLAELGFLPKMEAAGFPHKYGAAWTSSANNNLIASHDWEALGQEDYVPIEFSEREMEGFDQFYTYHVDRGLFDHLLLEHAREAGAVVCEEAQVRRVEFDDTYPVIYHGTGANPQRTRVRLAVDASGRNTTLGNQLKLKVKDPIFNQYALHTWFEGFERGTGRQKDYIFIHFLPMANTWVWQIPITEDITSFGVVTQKASFPSSREDWQDFFWRCMETSPAIADKLRKAKQINPLKAEGDYSYAMTQFCGDGYALIGDAARFVDPIFSSGVSVALNSARLLHADIMEHLETCRQEDRSFLRQDLLTYEETLRRGTKNWYEFIQVYYRLNILFTTFIRDPRYRLDVLKLLQGDVYDAEPPAVLEAMQKTVETVENNPNHLWHKVLGDLTVDAFKPKESIAIPTD